MTSYLFFCSFFIVLTTTKAEPTAKPEGSPDSKAQSFIPLMEIHPPLIPLPHPGIYPPGYAGSIIPQHLDIFQQPQYSHGAELNKDQGVKKDFKLVQKQVERKGKQLNKVSKVKKVYTDGRGGLQTKTEKLISGGHDTHGIGLGHGEHSKGLFAEQHLPYYFGGGHLPHFGHGYTLPYPYPFPGFGLAGQYGHILGPHGYGHLGYGFPAYGAASAQTHVLANPAVHSVHAKSHTAVGQSGKDGFNHIPGHVPHGSAHLYPGPGAIATTLGHGIGPIPFPHGHLQGINPVVPIAIAGPLHQGYTQPIGPLGPGHHATPPVPA